MVKRDNSTRWNSTFESIDRALLLRERITIFCFQYRKVFHKDELADDEWNHLVEIRDALRPFREATKRLEGNAGLAHHGTVWEALPALEALLQLCERKRKQQTDTRRSKSSPPSPLEVAYQNAWEKLTEYYSITDLSYSIYAAAVLLHPSHRKAYFRRLWDPEWIDPMVKSVKSEWKQSYSALDDSVDIDQPPQKKARKEMDFIDQYLAKTSSTASKADNFDQYINASPVEFGSDYAIFTWLKKSVNISPSIRQHCFDLLSIPAMSAEIERVFSSSKRQISPDRNRLHDDTIEMQELLRYWWRRGIVQLTT